MRATTPNYLFDYDCPAKAVVGKAN
jgi:hypothetical protein